jgi:cobalt-zinc-cadmium efflux system outer membrane protein
MNGLQRFSIQCVVCGLAALTAHAELLTLDEAVRIAREHNPELRAARQQIAAATGRAQQAALWPNPELELSAEDMPTGSGGFSRSQNMIGLSQTVPFPGKKSLEARAGKATTRSVEAQFHAAELAVVRDVKTAFYRVLAGERRVAIADELVTLAESLARTARTRVEAGAAAAHEQLRAEIEGDRTKTELTALRRELTEARLTLARLIGQPDRRDAPLAGTLADTLPVTAARAEFARTHPRLAVVVAARERAELDLRRARLDALPDVTLSAAAGRDEAAKETLAEFRVSLPLPLFDRGQARKREAAANAAIARAELTGIEQQLLQEFLAAEARLQAAADQVTAYRERILPKAEEALRLVQGGFEAGKFGFIDVLDTQRTLAEARLTYAEKLLELNSAAAELEALWKETQP